MEFTYFGCEAIEFEVKVVIFFLKFILIYYFSASILVRYEQVNLILLFLNEYFPYEVNKLFFIV